MIVNDGNPYAPFKANEVSDNVVAPKKETLPDSVNTIKEILEWVGEDQDKAVLVLENEESSEKPRTTLIEKLEEIINNG